MKYGMILALAAVTCLRADTFELTLTSSPPTAIPGGLQAWNFSFTNNSTKYLVVNGATMDFGSFSGVIASFNELIASNLTIIDPGQTATGAFGTAPVLPTAPYGIHPGTFTVGFDLYVFHPINSGISDLGDEFGLFLPGTPATVQVAPSAVPEPSTALLWLGGLGALVYGKRFRR